MNTKQAIQLAIKALEQRRQKLAPDANLHDQLGADYPYALTASRERQKIDQAIQILKQLPDEKR